jgi:hypothetical protein
MTRWPRASIAAIGHTPILPVMLVLLVTFWFSAGEIYAAATARPHHGETAAIVLGGLNFLFSCGLFFALARFDRQLRELRLPKQPQVRAAALGFIIGPILLAPCALVWWLNGGARDVLIIAMGLVAGMPAAFLAHSLSSVRHGTGGQRELTAMAPSALARAPKPWAAARIALGPPFSPAPWSKRLMQLAALGAVLSVAPIVVHFFEGSLKPGVFRGALHAAEFVGFFPAIALCWAWPLTRLAAILGPPSAEQAELALLPGLGGSRAQLRRLCLVGLGVPIGALGALLVLALGLAALEQRPHPIYAAMVLEFLLIQAVTFPMLFGQMNKPGQFSALKLTAGITSPSIAFTWVIWLSIWEGPDSPVLHTLRLLGCGLVLLSLAISSGYLVYSMRKFLRRPHLFVEMSS